MRRADRVRIVLEKLPLMYPDAGCMLDSDGDPFHLLIATILSARTTDESVNRITPRLWVSFPGPEELAVAETGKLEDIVHPLGFFRNKAASVVKAAKWVVQNGGVPGTMEELVGIPGVGRKTASVILAECFGVPAVIVDTHVGRLSNRLDLCRSADPVKIETGLKRLLPKESWISFSHEIGFHGRRVCKSRKPDCDSCGLGDSCPRRGVD